MGFQFEVGVSPEVEEFVWLSATDTLVSPLAEKPLYQRLPSVKSNLHPKISRRQTSGHQMHPIGCIDR